MQFWGRRNITSTSAVRIVYDISSLHWLGPTESPDTESFMQPSAPNRIIIVNFQLSSTSTSMTLEAWMTLNEHFKKINFTISSVGGDSWAEHVQLYSKLCLKFSPNNWRQTSKSNSASTFVASTVMSTKSRLLSFCRLWLRCQCGRAACSHNIHMVDDFQSQTGLSSRRADEQHRYRLLCCEMAAEIVPLSALRCEHNRPTEIASRLSSNNQRMWPIEMVIERDWRAYWDRPLSVKLFTHRRNDFRLLL